MGAIAGTAYIKINGEQKTLAGSWKVSPTKIIKTGVTGLSGIAGHTETHRVPYMDGSFIDAGSLSIAELEALDNATITLELTNGKTYLGRGMYLAGEPEHDLSNGEVSVRFEGTEISEM